VAGARIELATRGFSTLKIIINILF